MLSEAVQLEIERRAFLRGQSPETFISNLLAKDATSPLDSEAIHELENWRESVRRSGSVSGREGQPWREWIHEGHER